MNYGLPYKGSKNKLAKEIVDLLPEGEVFVDLFCGGCAVTHAAMLSGKYKRFIINDIDPQMPQFFADAASGKFKNEKRVISREDFARLKDTDALVATVWSFGNNQKSYLWSEENEKVKIPACKMILADTVEERLKYYRQFIGALQDVKAELERRRKNMERCKAEYGEIAGSVREGLRKYLSESGKRPSDIDRLLGTNGMANHYFGKSQWEFPTENAYNRIREACPNFPPYDYWGQSLQSLQSLESLERLQSLQSLQSLERLERLQRLQSLRRLERLETTSGDYQNVEIPDGAVVYCDPPYRGTNEYRNGGFDYGRFYDWLRSREYPVYVSEYAMPEDFVPVYERKKTCTLGYGNRTKTVEKIFVHERFVDDVRRKISGQPELFEKSGEAVAI